MLLLCLMGASIAEQPKIETRGGDITFKVSSVFSLLFFWIYTAQTSSNSRTVGSEDNFGGYWSRTNYHPCSMGDWSITSWWIEN